MDSLTRTNCAYPCTLSESTGSVDSRTSFRLDAFETTVTVVSYTNPASTQLSQQDLSSHTPVLPRRHTCPSRLSPHFDTKNIQNKNKSLPTCRENPHVRRPSIDSYPKNHKRYHKRYMKLTMQCNAKHSRAGARNGCNVIHSPSAKLSVVHVLAGGLPR